jgi:hypothetical protein
MRRNHRIPPPAAGAGTAGVKQACWCQRLYGGSLCGPYAAKQRLARSPPRTAISRLSCKLSDRGLRGPNRRQRFQSITRGPGSKAGFRDSAMLCVVARNAKHPGMREPLVSQQLPVIAAIRQCFDRLPGPKSRWNLDRSPKWPAHRPWLPEPKNDKVSRPKRRDLTYSENLRRCHARRHAAHTLFPRPMKRSRER